MPTWWRTYVAAGEIFLRGTESRVTAKFGVIDLLMTENKTHSWRGDVGFGALAIAAVVTASALGQIATYPNLAPWFAALAKPSFNPPNWVFAPVWTALYALMAFALWRVLRLPPFPARRHAILLFFAQLALNAAWSWMFFAAHSPLLGLINIVPQWLVVVATTIAFYRLDRVAGWCLIPLTLWVAYAGALNLALWRLND